MQITKWFWVIVLFLSLGSFFSKSSISGWYELLKLVEFVFFGWVVAQGGKKIFKKLFWVFVLGIILEGTLGILEFMHQGSINGLWYSLGERNFTASTPGIANASIHGQLILRPYATFPHPNVFAGYLVIALLFFLSTALFTKEKVVRIVAIVFLFFGTAVLLITLSRVAILVWFVLLCVGLLIRFGKSAGLLVTTTIGILLGLLFLTPFFSGRFLDTYAYTESVDLRLLLQNAALGMWFHNPLLGVGLNNFLSTLPFFIEGHVLFGFLQPVHNIFLLVLAETGIVGLAIFGVVLGVGFINNLRTIRRTPGQFSLFAFLSLTAVIAIGLTDHYFLTLQQGQLLFALILGLSFSHGTIAIWPSIKSLLHIRFIK